MSDVSAAFKMIQLTERAMNRVANTIKQNGFVNERLQIVADVSWEMLDPESLRTDGDSGEEGSYQRAFVRSRQKKLEETFDELAVGSIVVSRRAPGVDVVIDGRHRVRAMIAKGVTKCMCQVLHGLTLEEEARLFLAYNKERGAPKAIEVFKGRLIAKDDVAVALDRICTECEWTISKAATRPNVTKAVAELERTMRVLSNEGLRAVLRFISACWKGDDRNGEAVIIQGVTLLFRVYRAYFQDYENVRDAAAKLSKHEASVYTKRARSRMELGRESRGKAILSVMVEEINKGRRTRKLPMPRGE